MVETFRGWEAEALEFFEGLEVENSKAYWQRNKDTYARLVRAPMEALLTELEPEWGEGRIFRPYRDVRFSADKSPYKTHIGATLGGTGYVQLNAEGLAGGHGMWEMASDQLDRYRRAVDDEVAGEELAVIVAAIRAAGYDVTSHDRLKTAPRGYAKDHARVDLLRFKGLAAWGAWPAGRWLGTARSKDRLVVFFGTTRPLVDWLSAQVGPSQILDARR